MRLSLVCLLSALLHGLPLSLLRRDSMRLSMVCLLSALLHGLPLTLPRTDSVCLLSAHYTTWSTFELAKDRLHETELGLCPVCSTIHGLPLSLPRRDSMRLSLDSVLSALLYMAYL